MKLDMNELFITGRLVRDIELRQNSNGNSYVWFTLAVNSTINNGETQTDYLPCSLWGKAAELLATFGKKGKRMLITKGKLRSYVKVAEDGTRQSHLYVVIASYELMDGLKREKESGFFESFGEEV